MPSRLVPGQMVRVPPQAPIRTVSLKPGAVSYKTGSEEVTTLLPEFLPVNRPPLPKLAPVSRPTQPPPPPPVSRPTYKLLDPPMPTPAPRPVRPPPMHTVTYKTGSKHVDFGPHQPPQPRLPRSTRAPPPPVGARYNPATGEVTVMPKTPFRFADEAYDVTTLPKTVMPKTPFRFADGAYDVTALPKHTSIMPLSDKLPLKPGGINPFGPVGPNYIVPPPLSRVERMGRTITEGLHRVRRTVRDNNLNRAMAAADRARAAADRARPTNNLNRAMVPAEPSRAARVGRSVLRGLERAGKYVAVGAPLLAVGGIVGGAVSRAIFERAADTPMQVDDTRIDNTAYVSPPAQTESMINIAPARKKVSFEDESLRQLEPPAKRARYDNIDFSGRFATRKKRRGYYDFSQPSRFST